MRAVLGDQQGRLQQLLDAADTADTRDHLSSTRIQTLTVDEGLQASKKMYVTLVMTIKGSAQMILRGPERDTTEQLVGGHSVSGSNQPQHCGLGVSCRVFSTWVLSLRRLRTSRRNTVNGREVSGDTSWHRESLSTWGQEVALPAERFQELEGLFSKSRALSPSKSRCSTTVQYLQVSTVYDGRFPRSGTNQTTPEANPNPGVSAAQGGHIQMVTSD